MVFRSTDTCQDDPLRSDDPRLYGVTIDDEVARRAYGLGRDLFADAKRSGQIATVRVGKRRRVLGLPFRRDLGLPELHPSHSASIAA